MGLNIGFSSNKVSQCRCNTSYTAEADTKAVSVDERIKHRQREAAISAIQNRDKTERRFNPRAGVGNDLPNPKPDNYTIIRHQNRFYKNHKYIIVEIQYHDCTNYEGIKLMVFQCSLQDLLNQKLIDPHFCDDKTVISPIARFEPTLRGWKMANAFVRSILPVAPKKSKK